MLVDRRGMGEVRGPKQPVIPLRRTRVLYYHSSSPIKQEVPVVDRITAPKDIYVLIPRICWHITLPWQRDFASVIQLEPWDVKITLRELNVITSVLIRGRQGGPCQRKRCNNERGDSAGESKRKRENKRDSETDFKMLCCRPWRWRKAHEPRNAGAP